MEKLHRDVFVRPCKEFELDRDKLFKLRIPLYNLPESVDYCGSTFCKNHFDDIGMKARIYDPVLFHKHLQEEVIGLFATQVEVITRAESKQYSDKCRKQQIK